MFRKDILLAVKDKQTHRRLKHLPARPITLTLFLTSWPGLASWQILGNGHSLQTQGVSHWDGAIRLPTSDDGEKNRDAKKTDSNKLPP